jgi:hypothetical protein
MLADLFNDKSVLEVQLQGDDDSLALAVVDSLTSIASTNPDVSVSMLDHNGLVVSDLLILCYITGGRNMGTDDSFSQGCVGNCLEEFLPAASGCMHVTHSESQLTFPSGASLDFNSLSDKMFAIEAASLYAGLQSQMQQLSFNLEQVKIDSCYLSMLVS